MVRVPSPGAPLGSGQLQLLIRFWVSTTVLPFVLSNKMPLARHCHTLSWISNEEVGKAATSSHIKRLTGRGGAWGEGRGHSAHSVNMHAQRTSGGTEEERESERWALRACDELKSPQKEGHPRSIAEGRCKLSAFFFVKWDRIRTDCSHTTGPWICLNCCSFTDIVAKSQSQFAQILQNKCRVLVLL